MNTQSKILAGDGDDAFRASVVGASEVAALFDASPWLTRFELWHRKKGTIETPDFGGNERIEWGVRLEPTIIDAACERFGYDKIKTPERYDNGDGLGGHADQVVNCPERGFGILEVKTADWLVAKKWGDEPPLHYLLQIQTYMGLSGCEWGEVIVLVGGNELRKFEYAFRPKLYREILRRVAEFWQSVRDNQPPKPDYSKDGESIASLYDDAADTLIDLRTDNRAYELAASFVAAKAVAKRAEDDLDAIKAEMLEKLGNNGAALLDGYSVKAPTIKGSPDKIITAAMVGQVIKGRKPHRRLNITEKEI